MLPLSEHLISYQKSKVMVRDSRAAFLPVDLRDRLDAIRQDTGESMAAVSNRLLISLQRWTLEQRVEALKHIPWAIALDEVKSPEQAEEYLYPAVRVFKAPNKPEIHCGQGWREALENDLRIVCLGGGKKHPKVWQFKAHEDAELLLRTLEITWGHRNKSAVLETAFRWALQKPAEIWETPLEMAAWIEQQHGFSQTEVGDLLYQAEQFASRPRAISYLEELAHDGKIRLSYAQKPASLIKLGDVHARSLSLVNPRQSSALEQKWKSVSDLLAWVAHRYEDKLVPIDDLLRDADRYKFCSRDEAIALIEAAEKSQLIDVTPNSYEGSPWATLLGQGYRAAQLTHPVQAQCAAYELRDSLSRPPANVDRQKLLTPVMLRDIWMEVRWRSRTLAYVVNPDVAAAMGFEPDERIEVPGMKQRDFFCRFTKLCRQLQTGESDIVEFVLKGGESLVMFAPAK